MGWDNTGGEIEGGIVGGSEWVSGFHLVGFGGGGTGGGWCVDGGASG